ncbi:type II toxin-antitoxin system HipA family toxin [Phascolarctobacterium succinatutens]|uniref:type II toxin-antitoxin system HipA family toxin n=1 Tax=Phascolarctobacterium succinatutens TaxID=626940 RepID=UPI003AF1A174
MIDLIVEIEISGLNCVVGKIIGNDYNDARFSYTVDYLQIEGSRPISLSLPLQTEAFSVHATRNFFEGLLPEGFIRKCVAKEVHDDTNDYLNILAVLGNECLGAIRIVDNEAAIPVNSYKLLQDAEIKALAQEGATESVQLITKSHLSLTGASGKVGLYYEPERKKWFFPEGNAPSTHIVKQSHIRLKKIVANEQLCMLTAKNLGIEIPESFIVNVGSDNKEDILFATRRYDRKFDEDSAVLNGLRVPYRLHQEDFAQALGIAASDKYEKSGAAYLKRSMNLLRSFSSDPIADQLKLWDICIFDYLAGNTDNHIKNLSLLYSKNLKSIRLAPAYDIVSTMVYDSSTEDMAMSIGGIYNINDIDRKAFEREALNVGLGKNMALKHFDKMVAGFCDAIDKASFTLMSQGFEYVDVIKQEILQKGGIKSYL